VLRVGVDGFEGVVGVEGRRRGERKGALMEVVRRRRLGSRSCIEGGVDCRRVVNFRECDRDRRVGMGGIFRSRDEDPNIFTRVSTQNTLENGTMTERLACLFNWTSHGQGRQRNTKKR